MQSPIASWRINGLSALARLLRVQPELQAICRFGHQWTSDHVAEGDRWAPFHFITQGTCVVDLTDLGRTIPLSEGDVLVLPHGAAHVLRGPLTPAGARGPFGIHSRPIGSIAVKSNTDAEPETQLICGRLRFECAHDNLVFAVLPDAIVVSAADDTSDAPRLRMLMFAIQAELDRGDGLARTIATDLATALFVMVVRTHLCRVDGRHRIRGIDRASAARPGGRGDGG